VNATLPQGKRSDDHDKALARALGNLELKERFLPTVLKLAPKRQEMIASGFSTNFQLPQLGQGETAVGGLRGLLELPKEQVTNGTLLYYLYHSIFDIAGAGSNEKFIYPLALVPVYMGFSAAIVDVIERITPEHKLDESGVYYEFLYPGFKKAYPEFEENVFRTRCESKIFRDETGLAVLRVLALTRNTYKNPQKVLDLFSNNDRHAPLLRELAGKPDPPGPQIMLYYAPDMLRMGLGEDMADESGQNMDQAMGAMGDVFQLARWALKKVDSGDYEYQLNVQPIVMAIKAAGKEWGGGKQLKEVCNGACIQSNYILTEGMVVLPAKEETKAKEDKKT